MRHGRIGGSLNCRGRTSQGFSDATVSISQQHPWSSPMRTALSTTAVALLLLGASSVSRAQTNETKPAVEINVIGQTTTETKSTDQPAAETKTDDKPAAETKSDDKSAA